MSEARGNSELQAEFNRLLEEVGKITPQAISGYEDRVQRETQGNVFVAQIDAMLNLGLRELLSSGINISIIAEGDKLVMEYFKQSPEETAIRGLTHYKFVVFPNLSYRKIVFGVDKYGQPVSRAETFN